MQSNEKQEHKRTKHTQSLLTGEMACGDSGGFTIYSQREKSPELPESGIITTAELHGNASAFTVFATVRQSVLVRGIRDASRLYHLANNGADSDSESDEDADEKNKDATIKIPKVLMILSENVHVGSQNEIIQQ